MSPNIQAMAEDHVSGNQKTPEAATIVAPVQMKPSTLSQYQVNDQKTNNFIDMTFLCPGTFTSLGNSEVLWVAQYITFHEAVSHCKNKDSGLIEFWSETEWTQVINAFKF